MLVITDPVLALRRAIVDSGNYEAYRAAMNYMGTPDPDGDSPIPGAVARFLKRTLDQYGPEAFKHEGLLVAPLGLAEVSPEALADYLDASTFTPAYIEFDPSTPAHFAAHMRAMGRVSMEQVIERKLEIAREHPEVHIDTTRQGHPIRPNSETWNTRWGWPGDRYTDVERYDSSAYILYEEDGAYEPLAGGAYAFDEAAFRRAVGSYKVLMESYRTEYRESVMARLGGREAEAVRRAEEEQASRLRRSEAEVRFERFREDYRRKLYNPQVTVLNSLPLMEHGKGSSRRWGIEVETGAGRDLGPTPAGWEAKEDCSLRSAYAEARDYIDPLDCEESDHSEMILVTRNDTGDELEVENPNYEDPWYCSYCGEPDEEDGYDSDDCVEVVSPILTSFHSWGLESICSDLEGSPVTDSAGIHVHVEANDLTGDQVANLVLIYDRIEPLIEAAYQRDERGYCRVRSTHELLRVARSGRQLGKLPASAMTKGDRYNSVNLQSLNSHGTIEFRAMGPVYNYEHLLRWSMFCREIVNIVAAGADANDALRIRDWDGVLALFREYGVEVNKAEAVSDTTATAPAEGELVGA